MEALETSTSACEQGTFVRGLKRTSSCKAAKSSSRLAVVKADVPSDSSLSRLGRLDVAKAMLVFMAVTLLSSPNPSRKFK